MELFKRLDTYTRRGESTAASQGSFKFNLTPFTNMNYEFIHFNNISALLLDYGPPVDLLYTPPIILKCDELGSDFSIIVPFSGTSNNPVMFHWNKPIPTELNFNLFQVHSNGTLVPFITGEEVMLYMLLLFNLLSVKKSFICHTTIKNTIKI